MFRDVSFKVATGEVFVILGGSGSGKSTLLKQLIGLLPLHRGNDRDCRPSRHRARPRRGVAPVQRGIGVMFQSGALFGSMTLLENVMLPLEMFTDLPPEGRDAVARVKLGLVGLADAAELYAGGDLRRHGQARRHRAGDGARPAAAVPRRAVGGARSDHLGRAGSADPRPAAGSRRDVRGGDARAGLDPGDRRSLPHAGRRMRIPTRAA